MKDSKYFIQKYQELENSLLENPSIENTIYIHHKVLRLCVEQNFSQDVWDLYKFDILSHIRYKLLELQRWEKFIFFCNNGYFPGEN